MNPTRSVAHLLKDVEESLTPHTATPGLDSQVLLAHVLGESRTWVLAHPEATLKEEQEQELADSVDRLVQGEPLPYVLGVWEFYGMPFRVTPAVLIPRPETELLVEAALDWLQDRPERRFAADVGTGSGCIATALAANLPDLRLIASDASLAALLVARENLQQNGVSEQVLLVQSDLLPPVAARFDLICANLPYIPGGTLANLPVARYEPHLALSGGESGLDLIRRLLEQAPNRLAPGGIVLLEIEADQGAEVQDLAREAFPEADIQLQADLAGLDRLVTIQQPDAR